LSIALKSTPVSIRVAMNAEFSVGIVKLSVIGILKSLLKCNQFLFAFKLSENNLDYSFSVFSPFRDVPADTQIEIDGDRETERIYSLFTINMSKLQKLEGTQVVIQKNYTVFFQLLTL